MDHDHTPLGRQENGRPTEWLRHQLPFTWTWETGHPMAGVETNIRIELSAQGEDTFLLMTHFGLTSAPATRAVGPAH
ncbi:MAG: hypothetical protein ACREVR_07055 [Burkholderiales bacterium]